MLQVNMKDNIVALKRKLAGGFSPAMATPLFPDSYEVNGAVVPDPDEDIWPQLRELPSP